MPELELAWAAGFYDGEGCTHVSWSRESKRTGKRLSYPQISISQSGAYAKDILERFNHAVGNEGILYGPRPPGKNQKLERYQIEFSGIRKTEEIYNKLKPYLSQPKKDQFERVIQSYYESRS